MAIKRTMTLELECDGGEISATIHDNESGLTKTVRHPYSPDEHREFDVELGNEVYSWAEIMMDEEENSNGIGI